MEDEEKKLTVKDLIDLLKKTPSDAIVKMADGINVKCACTNEKKDIVYISDQIDEN